MDTRNRDEQRSDTTSIVVNGLVVEARVDHALLDDLLLPTLERLSADVPAGRRSYVFLAAPPGAGKSTLAALVEDRARRQGLDLSTVGIDGFHHPDTYLRAQHVVRAGERVPLGSIKGAPETFDVEALARRIEAGRHQALPWPTYDRVVHDVVPGDEPVTASLVLVEGNWLLLDEPGWSDLAAHSSFNIFLEAEPGLLRERLVERKVRGGLSREDALDFYERSDRLNVERVLAHTDRSTVDLLLHLNNDGTTDRRGSA